MPLVHIEHTVSRGSLCQCSVILVPDLHGQEGSTLNAVPEQSSGTGGPDGQTEWSCPLLRCWSRHLLIQDFRARWHRCAPDAGRLHRWTFPSHCTGAGFEQVSPWIIKRQLCAVLVRKISSRLQSSSWTLPSFSLSASHIASVSPSLLFSRLWCKCFDVTRGSFSSYSALFLPVCQLFFLTQPSGASPAADVLHEEAQKKISVSL